MDGKRLRFAVDNVNDLLTDVQDFIEKEGKLDAKTRKFIANLREKMNDLFYMIPLKE